MAEQITGSHQNLPDQTYPVPGTPDVFGGIDIDLNPSPYDMAYQSAQAGLPATEQATPAAPELSETERIAAHVQDMQARHGYYSYAEHGIGEEQQEPRIADAPSIGRVSLHGAFAPSAEDSSGTPAWAAKPLPSEGIRNKRYETIFMPHPTLSEVENRHVIPVNERNMYPEVTPESREASKRLLADIRLTDIDVDRILDRHGAPMDADMRDKVIDRIRTDADLRYDLGLHFLDKVQALQRKMPDRVREDTDKNPSYGRYPKELRALISSGNPLGSREYASLLALSMLDGTYAERPADPIERGVDGRATQGVHRAAAELLLQ